VRAKHGPQPASMRAAPAFRERLSDFEAASTGSFSSPSASGDLGLQAGSGVAVTRQKYGTRAAQIRPNNVAGIRRHASLSGILPAGAMLSRFRVNLQMSPE
ncbi:hypothetical protein, partial [Klebsiella quasipneumoniae]|uniref:hypothetical protein n=1 Tax=Klebsiella quasipneumoniae TaxID=1463165 RepID=UPI003755411D